MTYDYNRNKEGSTERTARAPDFSKLSKAMKASVESMLDTRVKIRDVNQMLTDVATDASGLSFTDNYNDPDVRRVAKLLYDMDWSMGEAFNAVERLERDLKKKAKTASDGYERATTVASVALATGDLVEVVGRKGSWPSDMFPKGGVVMILKGGSVGADVQVKERGDMHSDGHTFRLQASRQPDGDFVLLDTGKMLRALKVKVKS
jgi:hypothetical protein